MINLFDIKKDVIMLFDNSRVQEYYLLISVEEELQFLIQTKLMCLKTLNCYDYEFRLSCLPYWSKL